MFWEKQMYLYYLTMAAQTNHNTHHCTTTHSFPSFTLSVVGGLVPETLPLFLHVTMLG